MQLKVHRTYNLMIKRQIRIETLHVTWAPHNYNTLNLGGTGRSESNTAQQHTTTDFIFSFQKKNTSSTNQIDRSALHFSFGPEQTNLMLVLTNRNIPIILYSVSKCLFQVASTSEREREKEGDTDKISNKLVALLTS